MFFAQAVDDIIGNRRALIDSGAEAPRDLLTLLLSARDPESGHGMSDEDMRANILTFILAGHETTANALTWTLYLLSQSPEWRERAEAEAEEAFDPQRPAATEGCETLRAVFEEAMRLYPPAAMLSRQAIADDELAGVHIPAGAVISVSPYVLHRRRGLWDNPDAFDPSRFLGERRERIDRFAYIPFGAGPRVCIGMAFAMQEGIILLANLLRAFRFELVEGHVVMPHTACDAASAGGHENARETARRHEEIHSREFLCESTLTETSPGPICASPNGLALFWSGWAAGFGTFRVHSSLLRGGGGGFSVVPASRERGDVG